MVYCQGFKRNRYDETNETVRTKIYFIMHVYNALTMPYFDYCSLVWDTCSNYLIENLQKLQNRAARVISGKTYEIRLRGILSDLGWQQLEKRMKFKKAT